MGMLLPGTEVKARDLRWEVVIAQNLGEQTLYRLRGLEGAVRGHEFDVLHPFERIDHRFLLRSILVVTAGLLLVLA